MNSLNICRSNVCNHTSMRFIQADPEGAVAILKHFHVVFNELLLIRISNAGQITTLKKHPGQFDEMH